MNLFYKFFNSVKKHPDRLALDVNNNEYTYSELFDIVKKIAWHINRSAGQNVGIYSYRSLPTFSGILATIQTGKTYVPLNPKFPSKRNVSIIENSEINTFIVDSLGIKTVFNLLPENNDKKYTVIAPETFKAELVDINNNYVTVITKDELINFLEEIIHVDDDELAYILFTSGSTGTPKGVPISHKNVNAYLENTIHLYEIGSEDRVSNMFEITFDVSVHDIFHTWSVGASLFVVPQEAMMAPSSFIIDKQLTVWYSTPSLVLFLLKLRLLKEGIFPTLRYSMFIGEALSKRIAKEWQKAAPNSRILNTYGPAEATIAITSYELPKGENEIHEKNGIVSIGKVFQTQNICVIDENGYKTDGVGELCLSGTQLTKGYLNDPEKTEASFFSFSDDDQIWYKTGDLVDQIENELYYLSRTDYQVKIRGFRVELEEINNKVISFTDAEFVKTIPTLTNDGTQQRLICFIDKTSKKNNGEVLKHLRTELPDYMIPQKIIFLEEFPLNASGKTDLKKLKEMTKNY